MSIAVGYHQIQNVSNDDSAGSTWILNSMFHLYEKKQYVLCAMHIICCIHLNVCLKRDKSELPHAQLHDLNEGLKSLSEFIMFNE